MCRCSDMTTGETEVLPEENAVSVVALEAAELVSEPEVVAAPQVRFSDLPVPSASGETTTTRVSFDDWMWLQSENRLFNRAYMKKAGIDVGDVSISFEKLR